MDLDMAVAVKMREEAALLRASKVSGQNATAALQNPRDLSGTLLASAPREVVEHQRAQHNIESAIGKWQTFRHGNLKPRAGTSLGRLPIRSCDHRGRSIDAGYRARRTNVTRCRNRQRPRAATDVEHGFSTLESRKAEDALTQLTFSSVRQQPREQIVTSGPMEDQTVCSRCRLLIHRSLLLLSERRLEMCSREEHVWQRMRYQTNRMRLFVFSASRRHSWQAVRRKMRGWWVESGSSLSAREVDDVFLALVVPAVTSALGHAEG
jgi:hypothetical protein